MPRLLTIVVEVDQPAANWLWELHMDGKARHGITAVHALADGNQLEVRDKLEQDLEEFEFNPNRRSAWEQR